MRLYELSCRVWMARFNSGCNAVACGCSSLRGLDPKPSINCMSIPRLAGLTRVDPNRLARAGTPGVPLGSSFGLSNSGARRAFVNTLICRACFPSPWPLAKCVPTTQGCINGLDLAGYLLPSTPPPLARPLGPSAVLPGTAVSLDRPKGPVRDFCSSISPYVADIHLFCSSCASSAFRAFTLLLPRRTTLEPSF
jgi:hypothetical protein